MKKIENIYLEKDGVKLLDADSKEPISTISCIKAVLDNTSYENRGAQRQADRIYEIISSLSDTSDIELEDADFNELKRHVLEYKPFLSGRVFTPILEQFEE